MKSLGRAILTIAIFLVLAGCGRQPTTAPAMDKAKEKVLGPAVAGMFYPLPYTDDAATIRSMCRWLVDNVGPDCPVHFSRFMPAHKLTQLPITPLEVLLAARSIAREEGLHYPYIGNCGELPDGESTRCPQCGKTIVQRSGFSVQESSLTEGKCKFCQTSIPGVWA